MLQIPAGRHGLLLSTLLTVLCAPGQAQEIPADTTPKTHPTGLRYSVLTPGQGKVAQAGDMCVFSFNEWLADGTLIDGSKKRGKAKMQIQVGSPQAPKALAFAATMVGPGGRLKITATPQLAYGPQGQPGRIPPNATMVYEVIVHEIHRAIRFQPGDPQATKTSESGLKYEILAAGKGDPIGKDKIVQMEFSVWSLQGEFRQGAQFPGAGQKAPIHMLSHAFMKESLPQMRIGEVRRITAQAQHTVPAIEEETVWRVRLIGAEPVPVCPPSKEERGKSTKSGLFLEMLERGPGRGDTPVDGDICSVEFRFGWKADKQFVAGMPINPAMEVAIGANNGEPHKFLKEVLMRMQVGDRYRVDVPSAMSSPRMIPKDTVWELKLLKVRKPDPSPTFRMPTDKELTTTASGLKYLKVKGKGKGRNPTRQDQVEVHYSGWLTSGKLFDSSYKRGQTITFPLNRVIPGWTEGVSLMKPGEEFIFVIPGKLAYGPRGTPDGTIPPDATLVFYVKLVAIK